MGIHTFGRVANSLFYKLISQIVMVCDLGEQIIVGESSFYWVSKTWCYT